MKRRSKSSPGGRGADHDDYKGAHRLSSSGAKKHKTGHEHQTPHDDLIGDVRDTVETSLSAHNKLQPASVHEYSQYDKQATGALGDGNWLFVSPDPDDRFKHTYVPNADAPMDPRVLSSIDRDRVQRRRHRGVDDPHQAQAGKSAEPVHHADTSDGSDIDSENSGMLHGSRVLEQYSGDVEEFLEDGLASQEQRHEDRLRVYNENDEAGREELGDGSDDSMSTGAGGGLFVTPDPEDDVEHSSPEGPATRNADNESPLFVSDSEASVSQSGRRRLIARRPASAEVADPADNPDANGYDFFGSEQDNDVSQGHYADSNAGGEDEASIAETMTPDSEQNTQQTHIQQPAVQALDNHITPQNRTHATNVLPPLSISQLLALPPGPLIAPIPYPVIARTTRGYVEMTQREVDNQEGIFRKRTYQCLHPDCDNNRGKGYSSESTRDEHWGKHEPGYNQFRGGMRGLQTFEVI